MSKKLFAGENLVPKQESEEQEAAAFAGQRTEPVLVHPQQRRFRERGGGGPPSYILQSHSVIAKPPTAKCPPLS